MRRILLPLFSASALFSGSAFAESFELETAFLSETNVKIVQEKNLFQGDRTSERLVDRPLKDAGIILDECEMLGGCDGPRAKNLEMVVLRVCSRLLDMGEQEYHGVVSGKHLYESALTSKLTESTEGGVKFHFNLRRPEAVNMLISCVFAADPGAPLAARPDANAAKPAGACMTHADGHTGEVRKFRIASGNVSEVGSCEL